MACGLQEEGRGQGPLWWSVPRVVPGVPDPTHLHPTPPHLTPHPHPTPLSPPRPQPGSQAGRPLASQEPQVAQEGSIVLLFLPPPRRSQRSESARRCVCQRAAAARFNQTENCGTRPQRGSAVRHLPNPAGEKNAGHRPSPSRRPPARLPSLLACLLVVTGLQPSGDWWWWWWWWLEGGRDNQSA